MCVSLWVWRETKNKYKLNLDGKESVLGREEVEKVLLCLVCCHTSLLAPEAHCVHIQSILDTSSLN